MGTLLADFRPGELWKDVDGNPIQVNRCPPRTSAGVAVSKYDIKPQILLTLFNGHQEHLITSCTRIVPLVVCVWTYDCHA